MVLGGGGLATSRCLSDDVLELYIKAGRIAAIVREEAAKRLREGDRVLEFCEWVENKIRELGGKPAFPCNISINSVAAHYTPIPGDELRVPEGAVVKIDIGVHVEGYIADTAVTVAFDDKYIPLLEAAREALENAIKEFKLGVAFTEIGRIIEKTITSKGFRPVRNLSGHSLARYTIHAGAIIPNVGDRIVRGKVECGAYAIEPFATTGEGIVVEKEPVTIYAYTGRRVRARLSPLEKKLLAAIASRFKTLPFTFRWLTDVADYNTARRLLTKLAYNGILIAYPTLVERSGGVVAQFEHTVIVDGDNVIVTTLPGSNS